MPEFNASNAVAEVLTFKEGMLSPMAHDLRIAVQQFSITVTDGRVEADFDLSSLIVVSAQKGGHDAPDALSPQDRTKIEKTIRQDVLHTQRYPSCFFEANLDDLDGDIVPGTLELHGEERTVEAHVEQQADGVSIQVRVHQPDFGIQPYTAMMGALRIRPHVIIRAYLRDAVLKDLRG